MQNDALVKWTMIALIVGAIIVTISCCYFGYKAYKNHVRSSNPTVPGKKKWFREIKNLLSGLLGVILLILVICAIVVGFVYWLFTNALMNFNNSNVYFFKDYNSSWINIVIVISIVATLIYIFYRLKKTNIRVKTQSTNTNTKSTFNINLLKVLRVVGSGVLITLLCVAIYYFLLSDKTKITDFSRSIDWGKTDMRDYTVFPSMNVAPSLPAASMDTTGERLTFGKPLTLKKGEVSKLFKIENLREYEFHFPLSGQMIRVYNTWYPDMNINATKSHRDPQPLFNGWYRIQALTECTNIIPIEQ